MTIAELKNMVGPEKWRNIMDMVDEDYCNGAQGTELFVSGLRYLLPFVNVTLKNPEV